MLRLKYNTVMAIVIAFSFLSAPVSAHDFWVEPDQFRPAEDEAVFLSLREGVDFKGNTLPYINAWFQDFSRVDANGRMDIISVQGDDPAARVWMPDGALLIGYESNRSFTELPPEKFNKYLIDEGIEHIRAQRIAAGTDQQPAPEYFVRCAKTLLQSGNTSSEVYATRLGYRLELIPAANPYELNPGDSLTFTLYLRDQPAPNMLVQAFTKDAPDRIQKIRTDENGQATVQLNTAGIWMVKAVSIQPLIGSPKAQWLSHWASYLFELPMS